MLDWEDPFAKPATGTDSAQAADSVTPVEEKEIAAVQPAANEASAIAMPTSVPEPDKASISSLPRANIAPVNPEDKRVINGMTDINQLAPFKYPWAWEYSRLPDPRPRYGPPIPVHRILLRRRATLPSRRWQRLPKRVASPF